MTNQNGIIYGIAVDSKTLLFAMAVLAGFLILAILISMMRIYKKAGKSSISAIVPIWSQVVMFQIVGKPWWYLFLLMVPIANIVIIIQVYILLAKKFGKGAGFGIAMVFLPMIFVPLLSFYDYVGEKSDGEQSEEPIYNPFNQTEVSQVMPTAPMSVSEDSHDLSKTPIVENEQAPIQPTNIPVQVDQVVETNESIQVGENTLSEVPEISAAPVADIPNIAVEEVNQDIPVIPAIAPVINQNNDITSEVQTINQVQTIADVPSVSPDNQDIQSVLNTNPAEPKNIAFNSIPVVEPEAITESIETLDNNEPVNLEVEDKVIETTVVENEVEEVIEMPEIAAKTCPACGTSLAENIKFCTSCGTQL